MTGLSRTERKEVRTIIHERDDLCVVYSLALMNEIVMAGHKCRQVEDDINNPRFKVFLFDNTPEVQEIIKKYRENNKR